MNVKEIVEQFLEANGYDGLYNENGGCACKRDDLMPCRNVCGTSQDDCRAGYLKNSVDAEFVIVEHKGDSSQPKRWPSGVVKVLPFDELCKIGELTGDGDIRSPGKYSFAFLAQMEAGMPADRIISLMDPGCWMSPINGKVWFIEHWMLDPNWKP